MIMKRNVSGSGGTAPSAKNRRPLKYIVYTGEKTGCEVSEAGSPLALDNG